LALFFLQGITVVYPKTVFHAAGKTSFEKGSVQKLMLIVLDRSKSNLIKPLTLVLIEACIQQTVAIRICLANIHFHRRILPSKRENLHISTVARVPDNSNLVGHFELTSTRDTSAQSLANHWQR